MRIVNIDLGDLSYEIKIAPGAIADGNEIMPWIKGRQVFIVTNKVVAPLYLQKIKNALSSQHGDVSIEEIILQDGEEAKSLETARAVFDRMISIPLERTATVVALGGGVVGDIAGFAAACYQRGIPFIQIPTTLLAQVDSSVGGKTAVNHPRGKNMIGAFYQPQGVLIDPTTLKTLEPRQFSSGVAEVIKYGLINDLEFFEWMERNIAGVMNADDDALEYIIESSCKNKAGIVEQDEKESGVRALLNLGHTFGHAIEAAAGYRNWLHGEAVSLGMMMAAFMSRLQGLMNEDDVSRIKRLLLKAGLPAEPTGDFSVIEIKEAMKLDKKVQQGKIRLILLKGIGQAYIAREYEQEALDSTLAHFALG